MNYQTCRNVLPSSTAPLVSRPYRMHEEYGLDFMEGIEKEKGHPMWTTERIELRSVGIDIGSSTSHLMFSRLVLRRLGAKLSSKFVVVEREVIWKSDILLTPYSSQYQIDVKRLSAFLDQAYQSANMDPDMIDTGAVIITGEASRKENAEAITALFSKQAGKFVCATAGPNLEAMMAAYGSGAVRKSIEGDDDKTVMVIDVGGGTVKIAIVEGGFIRETAAVNIGGRLVAVDNSGRIVRIEEAGRWVAEELGIRLELGRYLEEEEKQALATRLAEVIFEIVHRGPLSSLAERLMVTSALNYKGKIDLVMFSGGVGEYIYGTETRDYGDLGRVLGEKIMERAQRSGFGVPVGPSEERIRATVIGASQYTIQVSGNTIFVSDTKLLPIRNLKVIFPQVGETTEGLTTHNVEAAIRQAFARFDLVEGEAPVALAFHWLLGPRHEFLRCLAEGLVAALKKTIHKKLPIVLVFNSDIGKTIGRLLHKELQIDAEVISIDQIHLHDFDFIDIGQVVEKVEAVPVVVKSLVFGKDAEESLRQRQLEILH